MKSPALFLLILVFGHFSNAQTAEELNQKSIELLQLEQYEEALPLIQKSAEMGHAEAQYHYGLFLQDGIGIEKNMVEAIKWFEKSSNQNYNNSHYALMMAYGNGMDIEQDLKKGFDYAMKCANNQDATCMWNVANAYLTGLGVDENPEKFKEWILKLAKLPNPENLELSGKITSARLELARFYRNGNHFEKDLYQSYLWYLIFNEFKIDFSYFLQSEVVKEIKELEKELNESQLKSASEDAEKLLGRKLMNLSNLHQPGI